MENSAKPSGSMRILSYDKPAVTDGLYQVDIEQTFQAGPNDPGATINSVTKYFAAYGPRFNLDPKEIVQTFPVAKTMGAYFDIIPHMMFSRSILPWERVFDSDPQYDSTPWLTLLLINKDEIDKYQVKVQTKTLSDIINDAKTDPNLVFPSSFSLEDHQTLQDKVNFIDIPEDLLKAIMPKVDELPLLANVRQAGTGPDPSAPKYTTLMTNRLPQPGQENRIYLISLEGRKDVYDKLFPAPGEKSNTANVYRFFVLTYWTFASVKLQAGFEDFLDAASKNGPQMFQLPPIVTTSGVDVGMFYNKGYIPLTHHSRQGNTMISWYRGPLLPGPAKDTTVDANVVNPDQLTRFFSTYGMFDMAYSAAWEIGRLLMLKNKRVSLALYKWKRANIQAAKTDTPAHLPLKSRINTASVATIPPLVYEWFSELQRLQNIPFHYLVPDERLLPSESLRFFNVDPVWVYYLMKGAFSIGATLPGNQSIEAKLFDQLPKPPPTVTGFILRSTAVKTWPDMKVSCYNVHPSGEDNGFEAEFPHEENDTVLTGNATIVNHLSKDVLFGIYEGDLKTLELYLQAETIHFGINIFNECCYFKILRDSNGDPYPVTPDQGICDAASLKILYTDKWVRIPFRASPADGTIDIGTLKDRLGLATKKTITVSEFAFQMFQGVPKVRYLVDT